VAQPPPAVKNSGGRETGRYVVWQRPPPAVKDSGGRDTGRYVRNVT
jgi:hypothetical protein